MDIYNNGNDNIIINTNDIEHDFETFNIDGLVLVNPRELGISVAYDMIENELIWESDIYNNITLYLSDIIEEAVNTALEVLEENNGDVV